MKFQRPENYIKTKTHIEPAAISIKKAAQMVGRGANQINNDIDARKLNYGYSFDETSEEDTENHGQKVVILDEAWDSYIAQKKGKKKRTLKRER